MEEKKSSFVDEFFPQKEAAWLSKSDILSSIFPPRSPVAVKDSCQHELTAVRERKEEDDEDWSLAEQTGASGDGFEVSSDENRDGSPKNNGPNYSCEIPEPCLMSSSVYYGGRDDFIPKISSTYEERAYDYNKDSEDADNSDVANRGEWWQGSFYY